MSNIQAILKKADFLKFLVNKNIPFKLFNHPPVFTVEQGKDLKSKLKGNHTKNLFVKNKNNDYFLFTVQSHIKVDLVNMGKLLNSKTRLSFVNTTIMYELIGVQPGSVSSFALINDKNKQIKFILDQNLINEELIYLHPLLNDSSIAIYSKDLLRFFELLTIKVHLMTILTKN